MGMDIKTEEFEIVSPQIALWTRVKESRLASIKNLEESLEIEKEFLKTAEAKLEELKQN